MKKNIAILPGDGIGPEVILQSVKILNSIGKKFGHFFKYKKGLIGYIAIKKKKNALPKETINICLYSDAILLGAVGNKKYEYNNLKLNPEQGLLNLRKEMGSYCNIRPIKTYSFLLDKSPIKNKIIENVDFLIYRELTGGIYFGKKGRKKNYAYDYCNYSIEEINRISKKAFSSAIKRKKKLTLIDKSNVLETSKLWREQVNKMSLSYPNVNLNFLYVDNAAMQIILNPIQFDVILTDNMFGDIISDEASVISGSVGLIPSSSIGTKTPIFEPIHGSYPEAKGKNIANPIASILSVSMMLEYFKMYEESKLLNLAVEESLKKGIYTKDINPIYFFSTEYVGNFISKYILDFK